MNRYLIEPGDRIMGFCGGMFGRDSYGEKTVVAVGRDWIVAREEDGTVVLATGEDVHERVDESKDEQW